MTLLMLTALVERLLVPVNASLAWMLRRFSEGGGGRRCQPVYVHIAHFVLVRMDHESLGILKMTNL